MERGVQRGNDRGAGRAVSVQDLVDELLAVNGVGDGLSDGEVLHVRVAVANGSAVGQRGSGVERELVESGVGAGVGGDALLAFERGEDVRSEPFGEVDLALDESLGQRIGIVVDAEDEFVDFGSPQVVRVVRHHADELPRLTLRDEEGPGADEDLPLLGLVREGLDGLGVDAAPYVLGQDVDG